MEVDGFMFKDFDVNKIDIFLKNSFPMIFDFEFDGLLLLIGGTVKDIIMGKEDIKDLDFTLYTNGKGNVLEFINKYHLKSKRNIYRGYKITYNKLDIDITAINDLYEAGHLNTDFLFYDIKRKVLIPIGIKKAVVENKIIDYYYQGYFRPKERIKKAREFLYFMNKKGGAKLKYAYNRPLYVFKALLKHPYKVHRLGGKYGS